MILHLPTHTLYVHSPGGERRAVVDGEEMQRVVDEWEAEGRGVKVVVDGTEEQVYDC